jgi:hypothetical protein
MNKTNIKKIKRPGSGRTKGSFSFVTVPLEFLCGKIKDGKTLIKVSRLQLEAMGFNVVSSEPQTVVVDNTPVANEIVVTDFDAPKQDSKLSPAVKI